MEKQAEEVDHPKKVEESKLSHGKAMISASSSGLKSWIRSQDPRIVRVSRAFGGKDRHSKVCTVKGLRDRRVRLSVPAAVQLYDLQDRLGISQPSKVMDWLLDAAKHEIDKLPPLPVVPGTNYVHFIHHPRLSNLDGLVRASSSSDPDAWTGPVSASKRDLREAITKEHSDERRHHHSRKGSPEQSQESNRYHSDYHLRISNNMPGHHSYNGMSEVIFRSSVSEETRPLFPNSILATPGEDEVRQTTTGSFANEFTEFPARP